MNKLSLCSQCTRYTLSFEKYPCTLFTEQQNNAREKNAGNFLFVATNAVCVCACACVVALVVTHSIWLCITRARLCNIHSTVNRCSLLTAQKSPEKAQKACTKCRSGARGREAREMVFLIEIHEWLSAVLASSYTSVLSVYRNQANKQSTEIT